MDLLLSNFQQIGNALGWALIHFIWQGMILVASYFVITRLFFKNKIHLHYWTGIFFIVLSLIIPIKEFIYQLQLTSELSASSFHQFKSNLPVIVSSGILSPADMVVSLIQKLIPYLVSIWMIVIVLISTNLTKSWFELIRLSKNNAIRIPNNLLHTLEKNSKLLRLKFKPIISISSQVVIPATFGFFKPVILLPASLISQLPQDQMEAILLHELCHIKRSDFIHNILQLLVETLFFYHPFTKWMSADIRKIREQCCDELVLKLETKPILYAKALTNLAVLFNQQNKGKTSYLQIAATDGELLNRIKILMIQKKTKSPLIHLISGILLSLVVLIFFTNMSKNNSLISVSKTSSESFIFSRASTEYENKPSYLIPNFNSLINNEEKQKDISKNQLLQQEKIVQKSNLLAKKNITLQTNKTTEQKKRSKLELLSQSTQTSLETSPSPSLSALEEMTSPQSEVEQKDQSIPLKNRFPKLIYRVNPSYSRSLRKRGIEGDVILSFNINNKGRVMNIRVDKSSPLKLLDGNARQALKKWRFDKSTINEENIKNRYQQIFSFKLGTANYCHNSDLGSLIASKNTCQNL